MPAQSESQRRLMALAEHHPEKVHKENRAVLKMSHKQLHEFASTKVAHKKGTGGGGGSPVKFRKREGDKLEKDPIGSKAEGSM